MNRQPALTLLSEGSLLIRPLSGSREDFAAISGWLNDERVLEWYEGRDHPVSIQELQKELLPTLHGEEGTWPGLILWNDSPAGYLQVCRLDADDLNEYRLPPGLGVMGIDLFIGIPELWGSGLGGRAVSLVTRHQFTFPTVDLVTLDPHVDNLRAIRCYRRAGFHTLGFLPDHEFHEGKWVDCRLMARGSWM